MEARSWSEFLDTYFQLEPNIQYHTSLPDQDLDHLHKSKPHDMEFLELERVAQNSQLILHEN